MQIGTIITGRNENYKIVTGKVELIYLDALASGTNEYISVTQILVTDSQGDSHTIKPRDVMNIEVD